MGQSNMHGGRMRSRARGFTLVEVMIAMFVFALVTVIFASTLMLSKTASKMNGQYAQAISLAQHKIDQLRAVGYGRLIYTELDDAQIVDPTPATSPYTFVLVDEVASYLPNPTATLTIANATNSYDPTRVKLVTVTITWKASPRRPDTSTLTYRAYIANAD